MVVPATAEWVDTGLNVNGGDALEVDATGTWTDGDSTSAPDGSGKLWADNFFNLVDLGVCNTCARLESPGQHWGALIGYIGDSPPAPGSYTSAAVLPEALKIFYIGSRFRGQAPLSLRLWLNKNADAYSAYTIDNSGQVTATITVFPSPQPTNLFPLVGGTLCVRNLILASPLGQPGLLTALWSVDCIRTLATGRTEGVALYSCLQRYQSIDTCIVGDGIAR